MFEPVGQWYNTINIFTFKESIEDSITTFRFKLLDRKSLYESFPWNKKNIYFKGDHDIPKLNFVNFSK